MFALVSIWADQQRSSISDMTGGSLKGVTPLRLRRPHQRSSGFDLKGTVFFSDAQCLKHTWFSMVSRRHYRRLARDIHPDKHPENVEEATRRWLAKWVL